MTDSAESSLSDSELPPETLSSGFSSGSRPEELPPVQPPSASYIIQLFLIPALIVMAVIGVWALFGKLADSDTNWQQLVSELNQNEHRRWRAALGLAQLLQNQNSQPDANGLVLAEQPVLADALTDLLKQSLESRTTLEDDIKQQEFLARTLGSLRNDSRVLPTLGYALSPEWDPEVRKSSLMALAMIAGRHFEDRAASSGAAVVDTGANGEPVYMLDAPLTKPTITDESVMKALNLAVQDEQPSIRHLAGYVLALVSGEEAMQQLKLMLLDGNAMARANAAVGLARNGLTDGVPALIELLQQGAAEPDRDQFQSLSQEEKQRVLGERQFEQPVILSNSLRAISSLWDRITEDQRSEVLTVAQTLADNASAADVRLQSRALLAR